MSMPPIFARDIRRTLLWILRIAFPAYPYGAVTLSGLRHSTGVQVGRIRRAGVRTPHRRRISAEASVCSVPSSIAFTEGIPIGFFSSSSLGGIISVVREENAAMTVSMAELFLTSDHRFLA